MVIAILADEDLKKEYSENRNSAGVKTLWADSIRSLTIIEADVYVDLLFEMNRERVLKLKQLLPKPILINSVNHTLSEIGESFIRINAWPTMLQREQAEISITETSLLSQLGNIFKKLAWDYTIVPDITGMITPRILAMVINEAYYVFGADISTKEEIDTAMKLGTNYPLGPFEWSEKIGLQKIGQLLEALSISDPRYLPSSALKKELI